MYVNPLLYLHQPDANKQALDGSCTQSVHCSSSWGSDVRYAHSCVNCLFAMVFYTFSVSTKHTQLSGLLCWGSIGLELLPVELRELTVSCRDFRRTLKLFYSHGTSVLSAIEMLCIRLRYINLILTLTLTLTF